MVLIARTMCRDSMIWEWRSARGVKGPADYSSIRFVIPALLEDHLKAN